MTSEYMKSHCYLVIEEERAILIDAGEVKGIIEVFGKELAVTEYIIVIHKHCDHIIGCSIKRSKYNCRVVSSKTCNINMKDIRKYFSAYYNSFICMQIKYSSEKLKAI